MAMRYPVVLPVEFEKGTGQTIDMSISGALIQTSQPFLSGAAIVFSVLCSNQHDDATQIKCNGVVARVDQDGEVCRLGVYLKVISFIG
jgi:hypothetical protein